MMDGDNNAMALNRAKDFRVLLLYSETFFEHTR